MSKLIVIFATSMLLLSTSLYAETRDIFSLSLSGNNGTSIKKMVTHQLLASDGIQKVCGTPLYFAGMMDDGVRTFNCDGTGEYIDGSNKGTFTWYYSMSPDNPSKLFIKSFKEWGMGPAENEEPAVVVYIIYKGGNLDGETRVAVIGVVQGQIQLSPNYASKKK